MALPAIPSHVFTLLRVTRYRDWSTNKMQETPRTLSGIETMRALRISRKTLKNLLTNGVLEGWQLGRILRVRLDSVEALLRSYAERGSRELR